MTELILFIICSVRLIINEGLEIGSQIEYIRRARAAGYAVIVTNTNLNDYESSRSLRRHTRYPIRVSFLSLLNTYLECDSRRYK
jgi:hypothetical protein